MHVHRALCILVYPGIYPCMSLYLLVCPCILLYSPVSLCISLHINIHDHMIWAQLCFTFHLAMCEGLCSAGFSTHLNSESFHDPYGRIEHICASCIHTTHPYGRMVIEKKLLNVAYATLNSLH